jgi:hypothetical protein
MFSAAVSAANGNGVSNTNNIMNGINKRSKMCDADANGKVGSACKR